ncbi:MAG: Transcriptional regulator, LysR family [uncultured Sphingomonadaceae bacterium]|uniref:Transcriptional regulator, LysR family n=1 Tax=uncultured Sphingomonadaceae bacterium TaxID=169976 RepID=A0A6J4RR90_9SPHN|nr:MAG: Transcriptional regulator, LysR family [uncultured Sphingomonadaceae bacterium]
MRTFLAVARDGTLSGAARALGVTQSTMSRRMAALERRAGARLLERTPRGYLLTTLGEAVLPNAERMEAEADAALRSVAGRDCALEGTVRVTTVDLLADRLIVPAVAALRAAHPGIGVELSPDSRSLSLSKREADVAVRVRRFDGHELVERRLGDFTFGLYASPAYLDGRGAPRDGSSGHALVTVAEDQDELPEARFLRERLPEAAVALRSNSREVQLRAAAAGLGVACLARFHADAEGGLERLAELGAPPARSIWLGVHRDLRSTPRVRAVTETIAAEVKRQAAKLSPV